MERKMLKCGVYAKGVELLCFKHALGKLSTIFPEMDMKAYKKKVKFVPCLCNMDERNYRNMGGELHRTKTLGQGDECCNFHVTKIR